MHKMITAIPWDGFLWFMFSWLICFVGSSNIGALKRFMKVPVRHQQAAVGGCSAAIVGSHVILGVTADLQFRVSAKITSPTVLPVMSVVEWRVVKSAACIR